MNIDGFAKINSGTGKLAKVAGTLKFTGEFNRGSGALSMLWTGSLTGV